MVIIVLPHRSIYTYISGENIIGVKIIFTCLLLKQYSYTINFEISACSQPYEEVGDYLLKLTLCHTKQPI